jgi:GTPase SAR1 family protein
MENENLGKEKGKKILIIGLSSSGKTSIILSLKGNQNLLSYYKLKPTTGVVIEKIKDDYSHNIAIWELGGQDSYRADYPKNFEKFGVGADKIIYVIDVQDIHNYELALSYFEQIINLFKENNQFPQCLVFLHKYDPGVEELILPEWKTDTQEVTAEKINVRLIKKIKKIAPSEFPLQIFKTTIYTVFKKMPI